MERVCQSCASNFQDVTPLQYHQLFDCKSLIFSNKRESMSVGYTFKFMLSVLLFFNSDTHNHLPCSHLPRTTYMSHDRQIENIHPIKVVYRCLTFHFEANHWWNLRQGQGQSRIQNAGFVNELKGNGND